MIKPYLISPSQSLNDGDLSRNSHYYLFFEKQARKFDAVYVFQVPSVNTGALTSKTCHICHKVFSRENPSWSQMYRRHMLAHTGSKPYKCFYCDFRSSRKDSVSRHVRLRHPNCQVSMAGVGPSSLLDVVQAVEQERWRAANIGAANLSEPDQYTPSDSSLFTPDI